MSLISFKYNNQNYTNWSPEDAIAAGIPENIIAAALQLKNDEAQKHIIRNKITQQAGDLSSLLGTATDAGHFAIYALANIIQGIGEATNIDDVKNAVLPFKDIASEFLQDIDAQNVKLPFMAKGTEKVIQEIKQRATKTAQILGE